MYKLLLPLLVLANITAIQAQTPCENGFANGFPCNQIDFYSQIDNETLSGTSGIDGNDIWGWTDPETGIEYALMGQTNGTVFVNLSNPSVPKIIGRLPSHQNKSSLWRDIKVYNNHAFIVADNNAGHGMQVFDLRRLRSAGNSIETFTEDAHYSGVSSAHNIVINEEKGYAYIVGARNASNGCGAGGLHIVDISSPSSPEYIGCFDADGYTHDAQVVTYSGPDTEYIGKQIAFNSNENTITIADVEDPNNTSLISKQGYSASGYAHQGWLTEDHKYFISNDELDESRGLVDKTRTLIWDVRDLDNPTLIDFYFSERNTIDHNLYTHNGKIFQSNYENGLVILDTELIGEGKMREIAFFDTYPNSNSVSFNGTWSNYPYFESGIVIVSDINRGLFVLQPNIKSIITSHPQILACDNQTSISVGVSDEVTVQSYQWQSVNGSNFTNLNNSELYSGVNTDNLLIDNSSGELDGLAYRCKVTLVDGSHAMSYSTNGLNNNSNAAFSFSNDCKSVQFTNLSENANSYSWDFGDGSEPSSAENPVHEYDILGTYTVTLTVSNACNTSTKSMTVELDDNVFPTVDFDYTNAGFTVQFANLSFNAESYIWDFGDGSEPSTAEEPSHLYEENGEYVVTLTAINGCGENTFSKTIALTEAVTASKSKLEQSVKLFPIPTNNQLNIQLSDPSVELEQLSIYNTTGKLVYKEVLNNNSIINTSSWEKGVYFAIFKTSNNQQFSKKLLKN